MFQFTATQMLREVYDNLSERRQLLNSYVFGYECIPAPEGLSWAARTDQEVLAFMRGTLGGSALESLYLYVTEGRRFWECNPDREMDRAYELIVFAWNSDPDDVATRPAERVYQAATARLKLDAHASGAKELEAICEDELSIKEIAAIAMVEEKTVRNATFKEGDTGLKTIKRGHSVVVDMKEAHRWLSRRRGFVQTQMKEA